MKGFWQACRLGAYVWNPPWATVGRGRVLVVDDFGNLVEIVGAQFNYSAN